MTMTEAPRTRFAPSPTGQVHIGNIRAAIFNWLYARHHGGAFLLRVEDTDRERSTPEAIQTMLDVMDWLGLEVDEEAYYQSAHREEHLAIAERLVLEGKAYRQARAEGEPEAILFRMPWDAGVAGCVRERGPVEEALHPDAAFVIGPGGISFATISKKGKPVARENLCLAGFRDLELLDENNTVLFSLNDALEEVLAGRSFNFDSARTLRFTRREVFFTDLVKGEQAKPLDGIKDLVIVRSDGSPVFHLANVCDDAAQQVSPVIRGDDHVENTYRHLLLFHALGLEAPAYAHLPMIVNREGKPYSKRDGDAYVGDFRDKGFLPEALFNYLALLGWSPGDDREVMGRTELTEAFGLDRVQASPAQVDLAKLAWMNGEYMRQLPLETRIEGCRTVLETEPWWLGEVDENYLREVIELLGDRIKFYHDAPAQARWFFTEDYPYDEKGVKKRLLKEGVSGRLQALAECFAALPDFKPAALEETLRVLAEEREEEAGQFNHPLRIAVSGSPAGPGLFEMLALLGRERVLGRIARTLERYGET